MASTRISDLVAGAAVAGTDLFPNVQAAGTGPKKTTAAQLATFFWNNAVLVTPDLGTPSAGVLTNCTGTAAGLTAGAATVAALATTVTTNANLTGDVTSVGNATTIPASTLLSIRQIPQNSKSAAYTTVLGDGGSHLLHPAADTNARTFTIDSNANVAYPVGTAITFVNQTSQVLSIAITTDTMTLAGTTTTGTRSLGQNGIATALKVSSTGWIISGTGLT